MLNGSERDSTAVHTSFFVAYTSRPRLAEEVVPTLAILANLIAVVEPLTQLERVISRPGQQMVLHRSVSADVHGTRASGEVPVCASPSGYKGRGVLQVTLNECLRFLHAC